jgi:cystathionine beta-lyase
MAAIAAVSRLVKAGEEILVNDDSYGGTYRIMSKIATRQGIIIKYINMSGPQGPNTLQGEISDKTKLVMIESPTNPIQRICDIRALASICHSNLLSDGGFTFLSIDNTMMSPALSRPLLFGADIVIHSATKFLSGHSDTMAGAVTVRNSSISSFSSQGETRQILHENLAEQIYFYQNAEGTALAPFDCWLVLRGVKTMALRVLRQQESALKIAQWLEKSPLVTAVLYAGLPNHPDHSLHMEQVSSLHSYLLNSLFGDYVPFSFYILFYYIAIFLLFDIFRHLVEVLWFVF